MSQGIKQLKAIAILAATLGAAGCTILEDGKVGFGDVGTLLSIAPELTALTTVNFQEGLAEIKDLTPEESGELVAAFSAKFNIPQKKVEGVVEELLGAAHDLHKAIGRASRAVTSLVA